MTTTYVDAAAAPVERTGAIKLHGPEGFEGMRKAGRLAADMLDRLAPHVVPGARTDDLDAIVYQMAQEAGGVPASLGYCGFAHSCCISINQVVCHGIPSEHNGSASCRERVCH